MTLHVGMPDYLLRVGQKHHDDALTYADVAESWPDSEIRDSAAVQAARSRQLANAVLEEARG